jgi:hypothetical protein
MKEKNFARSILGLVFALAGLLISIPASYFLQSDMNRALLTMSGSASLPDYIVHLPSFFGQVDRSNTLLVDVRNTLVYTAIGFVVAGFVVGELIKFVIKASREPVEPAKGS